MVYHSPFDLYYWFVTVFAGSMTMFMAIAFLFIAMMGAMFRMPALIVGISFALFVIMMATYFGVGLLIIVMVIAAFAIMWVLSRLIR